MTINDNLESFFGKPVQDYTPGEPVEDLANCVYRLGVDYDDEQQLVDILDEFLDAIDPQQLDALIIGMWEEAHSDSVQPVLDRLVERSKELPSLRALFVGDMTYEQCEISWIIQGAYNGLLTAFPQLETLRIRGANGLELEPFKHTGLRELVIECGGLPSEIVQSLERSHLPALERLELWLGDEGYGFDGDVDTYIALLEALDASRLIYLGLRNAPIADELACYIAEQAWLGELEELDLSMGTLGDEGALALLDSPYLSSLTRLNLSHHYISDEVAARLAALPLEVDLSDPQEEDDEDERYVAVAE